MQANKSGEVQDQSGWGNTEVITWYKANRSRVKLGSPKLIL